MSHTAKITALAAALALLATGAVAQTNPPATPPAAQQDRVTGGQDGDRQGRQGVETRGEAVAAPASTGSAAPPSAERDRTTGGQDGDRQGRQTGAPATNAPTESPAPAR